MGQFLAAFLGQITVLVELALQPGQLLGSERRPRSFLFRFSNSGADNFLNIIGLALDPPTSWS